MGEIAHVDVDRLHALAGRIHGAAGEVAGTPRPGLEPGSLPGSAVARLVIDDLLAPQIDDVVAALDDWADAARVSADAFTDTDAVNGERFVPR
ncbi:hypothetical protein [Mycobacterium sp. NAZ190054]|uniref:DUF7162 family protein n=1 Tax=Mycobacterium sp. NAZ190054 TaxID=1747766 RepID=UPI0007999091|nr:hypothetical protein [Mycobacterium sp. NAZ190054]KWX66017.1 hypothetical protein ASJ79_27030 [Mycobacterium sp. NAZ190054]